MATLRLLGAVMAGGSSRRMGTDKARLAIDGEPLWRRQERTLLAAGAETVIVARRPHQTALPGATCWRDVFSQAGPLAGLHAVLLPGAAAWVAVLAVDMPEIDAGWFEWLLGFCRPGTGAMARHDEACEPLAAIYPAEALREVVARLQRREHSLQGLALALAEQGRLALIPVPAGRRPSVRSLNRPADWDEFTRPSARQNSPSPCGRDR
jgi:molybdopterin-guanine dinucleotide biosynthesis protein A